MPRRACALVASGVQMVVLLALNDDGAPGYDHEIAAAMTGSGVPSFACSPDRFPELMASALQRQDLLGWVNTA